MDLVKKVIGKVLNELEKQRDLRRGHPPRVTIGPETGKRALLMYRSAPLRWKKWDPRFDWHENLRQSRQIAEVMVECGYQVDVVDLLDDQFVPQTEYHLFVGHGVHAAGTAQKIGVHCRKICLATGQYGGVINRRVAERFQHLCERRDVRWANPTIFSEDHYEVFDEIACFGNQYTVDTFGPLNMPVHSFPNYANPNIQFIKSSKKSTLHFLYMAAGQHIRKGLDLLLEVFASQSECHLHIFGNLTEDICREFDAELSCDNIHLYGYVKAGGRIFNNVCKKAVYYISPSCAEGMQGTALNAMAAGLIPVLSQEVGIDLYNCGFQISSSSGPELSRLINELAVLKFTDLIASQELASAVVRQYYSPEVFCRTWESIVSCRSSE